MALTLVEWLGVGSFYHAENTDSEKLSDLSKVTQLSNGKASIQIWVP